MTGTHPPVPDDGARRRLAVLTVGGAAFAAAAAVGAVVCPFNAVTGLDCPFCGGTRAVFAVARGDLAAAFSHNALLMGALSLLPLVVVLAFMGSRVSAVRAVVAQVPWAVVVITALVVFTVVRNLAFAWAEPLRAA